MDTELSPSRLGRIAFLARLAGDDGDLAHLAVQLGHVLEHMEVLAGAPVDARAPAVRAPTAAQAGWREDVPRPSLSVEEALAGAPDRLGDGFAVPAMLSAPGPA